MVGIYGILKLFLLIHIPRIEGMRPYVIQLQTYRHEFNKDIIRDMNASLITIDQRNVLNGSITLATTIDKFEIRTIGKIIRPNGRYSTLINTTFNGCDFIAQRFTISSSLASVILKYFRGFIKNTSNCPMKENSEIVISRLYIDSERLPAYLPEVPFHFIVIALRRNEMGFKIFLTGSIVSKEKIKQL